MMECSKKFKLNTGCLIVGSENTAVPDDDGSRLMKAVHVIAINPKGARKIVSDYTEQIRKKSSNKDDSAWKTLVANKIIDRYSKLSAISGGTTSLAGVVPGIGTAVALTGGALADTALSVKFQVDMVMCLALLYKDSLSDEDAIHMSYIVALCGALEKTATVQGTRIASKAGVAMVNKYLKGAVLQTIKELFKAIGVTFTKSALTKAIPFGVGVAIGSAAGYGMTRYVGATARDMFELPVEDDRENATVAD